MPATRKRKPSPSQPVLFEEFGEPTRWTTQQDQIFAEVAEGGGSIEVTARAGTGKSSTSREAMNRLSPKLNLGYAAFNRSIATEFQEKTPANCNTATLHSFGLATLTSAFGKTAVNPSKTSDIVEELLPGLCDDKVRSHAVAKLVSACKNELVDGSDPESLMELALHRGVDLGEDPDSILDVVPAVLKESRNRTADIDLDDMIWLPVARRLRPSRTLDVLVVDEAQDLNPCQHSLALDVLCSRGRVITVGDPRQAIYGFRGADGQSMDTMRCSLESGGRPARRFPLTTTWRCPTSHVDLANEIVPDLMAAPNAEVGEIAEVSEDQAIGALRPGHIVICRINAPLISACYRTLGRGVRAFVRGRDIGKGLLSLVERLNARSIPDLIGKVEDYRLREAAKLTKLRDPAPVLATLQDKVDCIYMLAEGCRLVDDIEGKIRSLFIDKNDHNSVVFSSVHRAKGLERDTVVILRPDILNHPMARTAEAKVQEANLAYVAATRSKRLLVFAGRIPPILGGA